MEQEKNNDEIDFGPLYRWLKSIVSSITNGIGSWLNKLAPHKNKIFIYSFLGAVGFVVVSFFVVPYYASNAIFVSKKIDERIQSERVLLINNLLEEENVSEVARILKIPSEDAMTLRSISYSKIKKAKFETDSSKLDVFFKVSVEVFNNSILDGLEIAILNYLGDIDFVIRKKELEKIRMQKLIGKIQKEIVEIDSLKEIVANNMIPQNGQQGFIYGEPIDPMIIYKEGIELYEKELFLEIALQTMEPIELVTGFGKYSKPAFPKKSYFALAGFGFMFLLSILYFSFKKKS